MRVGEEKDFFAFQLGALTRQCRFGTLAGSAGHVVKRVLTDFECVGRCLQPSGCAFDTQRKRCGQSLGAACFQSQAGVSQKGLRQQKYGVRPHIRQCSAVAGREEIHVRDTHVGPQTAHLVFHDVCHGADHHQALLGAGRQSRQHRDHGLQAGVFALSEGGFDAAAGVIKHAHGRVELATQALGSAGQVQLDHF